MKRLEIPKIVKPDEPVMYMNWKGVGRRLKQKYNQPLHYLTVSLLIKWDEWKTVGDFEGTMEPYNAESVVLGLEQVHRKFACPKHLAKLWIDSPSYQDLIDNKI
ncbi:Protein RDM1 [Linum grandiflorum]